MKLGPLTKLEEGNTRTLKIFDNEVMLSIYDVIFILLIYYQFGQDSRERGKLII